MKNSFYLIFVALFSAFTVQAAVLTVDNNGNSPGQYTSLQAAITAANAGDSIYISGSINSYGNVSLAKRLMLFGPGYNPAKQDPMTATIGSIALDTVISVSGASGSKIYGIVTGG